MDNLLEIKNAVKSFSGISALRGVDLTIKSGEIVGLIGAGNSGKTVLLDVIAGIKPLDSGTIHFAGQNITRTSCDKIMQSGITRTFKFPGIFPGLTVFDHLSLHSQQKQIWRRLLPVNVALPDRAFAIIEQLHLADLLDTDAQKLSTVQQHRLEIAMALLPQPLLVLLDEPFTGNMGDDELQACLRNYHVTHKTAMLIVDHELDIIRQMCHRVLIMNSGKIVADGIPADILTDEVLLNTFYLA